MKILVISANYPSLKRPHHGAFVYNLVQEFAKDHSVTVISATKIFDLFKKNIVSTYGDEKCKVLRPMHFSFSNKKIYSLNTEVLSRYFTQKAILSALEELSDKPDIIYCHFLRSCLPILNYAKDNDIPVIVASGESSYKAWRELPGSITEKAKKQVSHIVCVSEVNKLHLIELGFDSNKLTVIPNAVDYTRFKPLDKHACKKKLGFTEQDFVVGFVGHFIHRKGPDRLVSAIKKLQDKDIRLVCVGRGKLEENEFTTVLPPVPNEQLPEIYNAFDVFVLPTLSEGHCNVIEEAKACGVPVISSKGTSVELQLTEKQGILVDPLDIDAISHAIQRVKNDDNRLSELRESLQISEKHYSINERARKIINVFLTYI